MPNKTCCPRCKNANLVRFETVIKANQSSRRFDCGACGHNWNAAEDGPRWRRDIRKPDQADDRNARADDRSERAADRPDRSRP